MLPLRVIEEIFLVCENSINVRRIVLMLFFAQGEVSAIWCHRAGGFTRRTFLGKIIITEYQVISLAVSIINGGRSLCIIFHHYLMLSSDRVKPTIATALFCQLWELLVKLVLRGTFCWLSQNSYLIDLISRCKAVVKTSITRLLPHTLRSKIMFTTAFRWQSVLRSQNLRCSISISVFFVRRYFVVSVQFTYGSFRTTDWWKVIITPFTNGRTITSTVNWLYCVRYYYWFIYSHCTCELNAVSSCCRFLNFMLSCISLG